MAFKTRNKDGKEVTHDIDDKIGAAITDAVESAVAGVAGSIGETVKSAVAEAVKPVVERLDKVEAGGGGGGDAGDEDDNSAKGKGGSDGDEAPAWAKGLIDTVGKLSAEREQERTARTTEQLVRSYVEKNLPNIKAKDRLVKRLIAAAPKDEAGLKSQIEEIKAEWSDAGVDVAKAFSADPAKEGAKAPDGGADDLEARKAANLRKIREQGRGGLKPVAR